MANEIPSQSPALTTVKALIADGLLPPEAGEKLADVEKRYAISVPRHFAGLFDREDPHDPIARQVLPSSDELTLLPEERADPIGDETHSPVKGLVHRYPDRVLLKLHSACAVYCRFCFRREMVGPGGDTMSMDDLQAAYSYIAEDKKIWEVILTGGDPLVLSPTRLDDVLNALDAIDHIGVVRLHTRLPIAGPERISPRLINVLTQRRATVYVAIHTNHEKELTQDAIDACQLFTRAGIPLLGQTVLLKGINDDVETLDTLFRKMVRTRITPYYLHHPDLARGTSHFRVSIERGQSIMKALRGRLSGIALPAYMLDIPGGFGKVPIGPTYAAPLKDGVLLVDDGQGRTHQYPPASTREQG